MIEYVTYFELKVVSQSQSHLTSNDIINQKDLLSKRYGEIETRW